jgi:uncharacterized damage-inducible protein DinB
MLDPGTALMLAQYNAWADRVLFGAIAALPQGAAYRTNESLFGSIAGTLNHNLQVDLIWKANLLGEAHGFTSRRDLLYPQLDALEAKQAEVDAWFVGWAGRQTPDTFAERVEFSFVSGKPGAMTRAAMFLHVVNHKTYHRGWVAEMFFGLGAKPPQTDLSVFLCEAGG